MKRLLKALFILTVISVVASYLWYRWQRRAPGPSWRPDGYYQPPPLEPEPGEPPVPVSDAVPGDLESRTAPVAPPAVFGSAESDFEEMAAEDRLMEAILPVEADEEPPAEVARIDEAPRPAEATEDLADRGEERVPWPWQRRELRGEAEQADVPAEAEPASTEAEPEAQDAAPERWSWPWQRSAVPELAQATEEPAAALETTPEPEPAPEAPLDVPAEAATRSEDEQPAQPDEPAALPMTLVPDDLVAEVDRPAGDALFDEGLAEARTETPAVATSGFDLPWQGEPGAEPPATEPAEAPAEALPGVVEPTIDEAAPAVAQPSVPADVTLVPEDIVEDVERLDEKPLPFDDEAVTEPVEEEPRAGGFRWPWQRPATEPEASGEPAPAGDGAGPEPAPAAEPPVSDTGFRWPWQRRSAEAEPAAAPERPAQEPPAAVEEPPAGGWAAPAEPPEPEAPPAEPPPPAEPEPAPEVAAQVQPPPEPAAEVSPPPGAVLVPPSQPDPLSGVLDEALEDVRPEPVALHTGRGAESFLDEGNVYFNVGQYGLAIERYTRAIEIDPNLTAGYYNRANARTRAGEYDYALADYDRALELEPNDADALNNRGMLHLYRANYAAALRDFNTALTIDPSDTTVIVNRGLAHLHGGDAAAALVDFQEAAALDDTDAAAHYGAGQAAAALANRDEALRRLRRALQIDPAYAREAAADPKLAALQGDAEFMRILREAGGRR